MSIPDGWVAVPREMTRDMRAGVWAAQYLCQGASRADAVTLVERRLEDPSQREIDEAGYAGLLLTAPPAPKEGYLGLIMTVVAISLLLNTVDYFSHLAATIIAVVILVAACSRLSWLKAREAGVPVKELE